MSNETWDRRRFIRAATAGGAALAFGRAADAALPDTIRFVVSYVPGGASDILARSLANGLAQRSNRTVIVENKPGAGGLVAFQTTKSAPADGSVLFISSAASIIQSIKPANKIRLDRDFTPIILTHRGHFTLFSNASVPATTLKELVAYDRANPGKLSYASFGVGAQTHLSMELLKQKTGMTLTHVPYKSNAEAIMSVVKGETHVSFNPFSGIKQHIDAGRVRALAVTSAGRSTYAPGVPGMRESGVEGYDVSFWFGWNAPAGTPDATVEWLNQQLNELLREPAAQAIIRDQFGADTVGGSRADFGRHIASEMQVYEDLIRTAHIKLDD